MPTAANPFTAKWSAQGHNLCTGHWQISYQGLPLTLASKQADNHMNTYGIFSCLYPDDEDYAEGLSVEPWIEENADWLSELFEIHNIPFDSQYVLWFYEAVNGQDWRCDSCGGCM
jgi:hypothetical protein